jgi:two-component system, chemotaxis family, response regulator Rcp1
MGRQRAIRPGGDAAALWSPAVVRRPVLILLVEDSPADVRLTREALREARIAIELQVVGDGEEAMRYLRGEGEHAGARRPDLVLLDLNLPGKDGREVLAEVKADRQLRRIPVVVLTTSGADEDILRAYDDHANSYIRKPVELDHFVDVVRSIEKYWTGAVALPPG